MLLESEVVTDHASRVGFIVNVLVIVSVEVVAASLGLHGSVRMSHLRCFVHGRSSSR